MGLRIQKIDFMAGPFTPKEVCGILYLGNSISGREGKFSIFFMDNPNVSVEDVGNFTMNIHIIPLDAVMKATTSWWATAKNSSKGSNATIVIAKAYRISKGMLTLGDME